jgi:glutamine synthetase
VAPFDLFQDIRSEMVNEMIKAGLKVERHHHEVATAGQTEIDLKFAPMIQMADWMQIYKYIVKNVAAKYGKTATFMPKPLFEDNGSGMHVHQSLWKDGKPLFAGDQYAGLSQDGAVVHRRHLEAHQLAARHLRADDQLLSPPGAGL